MLWSLFCVGVGLFIGWVLLPRPKWVDALIEVWTAKKDG